MSAPPDRWIAVAHLLRPQGRRGELLAEALGDPGLFQPGLKVRLHLKQSSPSLPQELLVESSWLPTGRNAGRVVLKFAGVDSISAAEALGGHDLLVDTDDLPARAPDSFLVRDLLGCTLTSQGRPVGEVVDLQFATTPDGRQRLEDAAPLLVVCTSTEPGAEPALVPFVKAWLERVDLEQRLICMHLPEGLLPPTAEESDIAFPPG